MAVGVGVLPVVGGLVVFFVSFVFSVSPCGVCSVVSARSGRRLSGGALSACCAAVVRASRRSSAPLRFRAFLARRCSALAVFGSCARCAWASRCPSSVAVAVRPAVSPFVSWAVSRVRVSRRVSGLVASWRVRGPRPAFVPLWCPLSFRFSRVCVVLGRVLRVSWVVGVCVRPSRRGRGLRRWRLAFVRSVRVLRGVGLRCRVSSAVRGGGGGGGSPAPVPAGLSASLCGSVGLFSSPAFVSAVAGGACPVSVASSVFSAWPLRSGVLWALFVALRSPRVRSFVLSSAVRPSVVAFVRAGVASLGFASLGRAWSFSAVPPSVVGAGPVPGSGAGRALGFVLGRCPSSVPAPVAACSPVAVSSSALLRVLVSLRRCLWSLSRRSSGRVFCPGACRPALASVLRVLLALLAGGVFVPFAG